jgi:hypothetical protein
LPRRTAFFARAPFFFAGAFFAFPFAFLFAFFAGRRAPRFAAFRPEVFAFFAERFAPFFAAFRRAGFFALFTFYLAGFFDVGLAVFAAGRAAGIAAAGASGTRGASGPSQSDFSATSVSSQPCSRLRRSWSLGGGDSSSPIVTTTPSGFSSIENVHS